MLVTFVKKKVKKRTLKYLQSFIIQKPPDLRPTKKTNETLVMFRQKIKTKTELRRIPSKFHYPKVTDL